MKPHRETRPPHTVVADWTADDLRCVIVVGPLGQLNGYVAVPEPHPLHGLSYREKSPALAALWEDHKAQPLGESPPLVLLIETALGTNDPDALTPERVLSVHGGITYSGDIGAVVPETETGWWWFGFNTAHVGDAMPIRAWPGMRDTPWRNDPGDVYRDEEYVRRECESLAGQLASLTFISRAVADNTREGQS